MLRARVAALGFFAAISLACLFLFNDKRSIQGQVLDAHGPVEAAWVQVQGDRHGQLTDAGGLFRLRTSGSRPMTAWKEGYRIAAADPSRRPLALRLEPLPACDNEDYRWVDPFPQNGASNNCSRCHDEIFREWSDSGHARAAVNPKFLSLYADPRHASWNLQVEYPDGGGVCAACHAPTYSSPDLSYDLRRVQGVAARGVHCDYCHKIADAPTDKLGTRFGRDGLPLLRPAQDDQLFFGPLKDAVRPGESFAFNRVYQESRYCASCHEGIIFGTHVYGTYSEWLRSGARRQGLHCQHCHMQPSGHMSNIAPGKGGIERDPTTLASHSFPGGQADTLRRCLNLEAAVAKIGQGLRVDVAVKADNVGHHVPTGFIDRNLVLVVEAWDEAGAAAPLLVGPRLGSDAGRAFAGLPGWVYAKKLVDAAGRGPYPFWLPHETMFDTRLQPGQPDRRSFVFEATARHGRVRLLYRRFWPHVADSRGWHDNEVTVIDKTFERP